MLSPDSDVAPSSNCQYWWTPASIGRSLPLSYITGSHKRHWKHICQGCAIHRGHSCIDGSVIVLYTLCVTIFQHTWFVLWRWGMFVPCAVVADEWTSCLAHQTHTLALALKICHTNITVHVIAVYITVQHYRATQCSAEIEWLYFQRDSEWCLSPSAWKPNLSGKQSFFRERGGSK